MKGRANEWPRLVEIALSCYLGFLTFFFFSPLTVLNVMDKET